MTRTKGRTGKDMQGKDVVCKARRFSDMQGQEMTCTCRRNARTGNDTTGHDMNMTRKGITKVNARKCNEQ